MTENPLRQLREPFPAEQIGHLPKVVCSDCSAKDRQCGKHPTRTCTTCRAYVGKHIHIDFVGHAHVTERLLSVDPLWFWEPLAFNGNGLPALDDNQGLWIKLHVAGMSRIGYGHAAGKRGGDAIKEIIGDAIRNAAMRFGVALDLWKKESPGPVEDVPSRQVDRPKQTPDDRAKELRAQIAIVGKGQGKTIDLIAGEFAQWSKGTAEITSASVAVLAEYLDYLQRQGAS